MFFTVIRFILSIAFIPACIIISVSFYKGIANIKDFSSTGFIFILGAFFYSLIHLLLFKLDFLYVLGHELMHAIATIFSGGKASGMKVKSKEGSVKSTTPNMFVVLAPYIIPGYTVFIGAAYFIASFFIDVSRFSNVFIFLIGFTLMFHLSYTAQSIREKQSDLIRSGYLFSLSAIYIVNIIIVFFIMSMFFDGADFLNFLSDFYERSKEVYYSFWRQLFL